MENFRITIGRQYGSGGKEVGRILAKKLGIPIYGKEELMKIAELLFEKGTLTGKEIRGLLLYSE